MKDIEISVDITHKYISDLIVTVISPQGTEVKLHDHTRSPFPNIIKTYTVRKTPGLRRFIGEFAQGEWKLRIADIGGMDVGKLNSFLLKILY